MKIGIYDPYLDDLGGGEKYMLTIAECLAKKHKVSIFWDHKKDIEAVQERFLLDLSTVTITKNIFAHHVPFLQKILETKKYDAIIFLSDGSVPFSLSKKLFLHIQQPLKQVTVSSWKNMIKHARITKIFYNSAYTQSYNKQFFPNVKSAVIYPPVSFFVQQMKKENIIMHVGRFRVGSVGITDYKKQHVMIDAFKQLVDRYHITNWKFVLGVSLQEKDRERFSLLQKQAKGYPIEFLLNAPNDALLDKYNKAKIYWHASGFGEDLEKHPAYAEHFGISTVEAMGAGAVPVVINAGGQPEIVTDGENGFLWNTLEELEEKTVLLMRDESLRSQLSHEAQKRSKEFAVERFSQKVNELVMI